MKYYKLDVASIPDDLFNKNTNAKEWLSLATTCDGKFPPGSLNEVLPLDRSVEIERIFGISLYMAGNVAPFALPLLLALSWCTEVGPLLLKLFVVYFATLLALNKFYFFPKYIKAYNRPNFISKTDIKDNQYLHTERNNAKYISLKFVWPQTIHKPALDAQPTIFCAIPHGAAPYGITSYPLWSKLFNDRLTHWVCAPVLLRLPVISTYLRAVGYIPARTKDIEDTLTKKEENVGIVLDGIAGMFQGRDEVAYIRRRKGIVKIALRAGAPLVPCYGFGHTSLYDIVVDPFGVLETLSVKLNVSVCPFFGRFGWFLGPPKRVAVCMCMGEPVRCPQIAEPTREDIDKYHGMLVKNYEDLFEHHKEAYGWSEKSLKVV